MTYALNEVSVSSPPWLRKHHGGGGGKNVRDQGWCGLLETPSSFGYLRKIELSQQDPSIFLKVDSVGSKRKERAWRWEEAMLRGSLWKGR